MLQHQGAATTPARDSSSAPAAAGGSAPILRLRDVSKTFSRDGQSPFAALSGLSLDIPRGAIFGIIGPSGAGKSTLIRLLNGLDRPSQGRIELDGRAIEGLAEHELRPLRRRIGMIFQQFNLLSSRTALGNVALPLELTGTGRAERRARATELLDLVGLRSKADHYPAQLSGGEKQRVAIARALANDPAVLLSDEATSALDPETTRSILRLLAEINRRLGVTIVLITHEMAVIKEICGRVAVLEGGHLVEEGPVGTVFARPSAAITRRFVASATGSGLPDWLQARLQPDPLPGGQAILRVTFEGPEATDPVISRMARALDLDVGLLAGQLDSLDGTPFGVLTVAVPGDPDSLARVRAFLAGHHLTPEILGHVPAAA